MKTGTVAKGAQRLDEEQHALGTARVRVLDRLDEERALQHCFRRAQLSRERGRGWQRHGEYGAKAVHTPHRKRGHRATATAMGGAGKP